MKTPVIVKQYKKNDFLGRKMKEVILFKKGYFIYSEEETKGFSGAKAFGLGILFLPLALFGGRKYIKVTYHLKSE